MRMNSANQQIFNLHMKRNCQRPLRKIVYLNYVSVWMVKVNFQFLDFCIFTCMKCYLSEWGEQLGVWMEMNWSFFCLCLCARFLGILISLVECRSQNSKGFRLTCHHIYSIKFRINKRNVESWNKNNIQTLHISQFVWWKQCKHLFSILEFPYNEKSKQTGTI